MVSTRCIHAVKQEMIKLGFQHMEASLGEVDLRETISAAQLDQIRFALLQAGFGLLEDRKSILSQRIKTAIIQVVHYSDDPLTQNLSVFLSDQLHYSYTYLSNIFSEKLGITIEKFYICHKIERVKELLTYAELSLTDVADKMNYSSVAHLSGQFKKVTGQTPSQFKQQKGNGRVSLENVCN